MKVNLMGAFVDPDQMVLALEAGASLVDLHQRAFAGEFTLAVLSDVSVLI